MEYTYRVGRYGLVNACLSTTLWSQSGVRGRDS